MKKNTGYREMLRDRCPRVVSLALKLCKAKEKWLNHVYKNFIWIYSDNEERLKATKLILGINNKRMKFKFEDTIKWDDMQEEEIQFWNTVSSWVLWFSKKYSYIQNEYEISKRCGKDIVEIKQKIMLNYLSYLCPTKNDDEETQNKKSERLNYIVDFLISSFENNI